jgi:predicted CoA-binding protein
MLAATTVKPGQGRELCLIAPIASRAERLPIVAQVSALSGHTDDPGNNHRVRMHSTPAIIRDVLTRTTVWAVVGCSPDPRRDSHRIARLLQSHGYRVIPVNPAVEELLGERCYPSITAIPADQGVEVVDIFRRADQAGPHVDEAIAAGAQAVWLQLGVVDEPAAQRALEAGLQVVMDRCPAIELPRITV